MIRTNYQLDTPFKNPEEEEGRDIEVTDPRHPLFGQRFPLLSISSPPHSPGQVFVAYRGGIVLRIPLASTTLAVVQPPACTKLTFDAVTDLLRVAEDCEALCPHIPPTSGRVCPPNCNNASETTSRRFSRR
jgi:hypothetical protein